MPKGLVEKVTWFSQWEYQNKVNHNFVVKFKDSDERYIYVGQDKDNPKFKEGLELEYKLDGRKIKGNIGQHQFEYEKISPIQTQGGGFNGGGGGKYVRTKEQELNQLLGTCASYSKDLLCHRISLGDSKDHKALAKVHVEMATEMYNGLKGFIQ